MGSMIKGVVCAGLTLGAWSFPVQAIDTAPESGSAKPAAPTTQPINPKVRDLIEKLAADDPTARETASKELEAMGREILPALKEEANSENPEQRARIRSLIRRAERRLPPAAPPRQGIGFTHSMRMSVNNGERTVEVDDNGYKIRIRQGAAGITLDVTGVEDGKEVTETYKAKDADQLKKDNPEAFALYDKYNNGGGNVMIRAFGGNGGPIQGNVRIQVEGGGVGGRVGRGAGPAGGNGAPPAPNVVQDPAKMIEEMRKQIEQQLQQPQIPEEHRQRVREMLERMERRQQDVHDQVLRQIEEERRKGVDELKVPDKEDKPATPEEPKKDEPKKEEEKK